MLTKAVRLHGKNDLRLDTFELPEIKDDEILVKVISDSICMSTYKAAMQGSNHKRVPDDIAEHPVIIGHEFCGVIVKVGTKLGGPVQGRRKVRHPARHRLQGHAAHPRLRLPLHGRRHPVRRRCIPEVMDAELPAALRRRTSSSTAPCPSRSAASSAPSTRSITPSPACYVHEMGIVEGGNMAHSGRRGPHGSGRHRLRHPLRPQARPAGRDRHRPGPPGPRRFHLHRGRRRRRTA